MSCDNIFFYLLFFIGSNGYEVCICMMPNYNAYRLSGKLPSRSLAQKKSSKSQIFIVSLVNYP